MSALPNPAPVEKTTTTPAPPTITDTTTATDDRTESDSAQGKSGSSSKRRLFGLLKKKDDKKKDPSTLSPDASSSTLTTPPTNTPKMIAIPPRAPSPHNAPSTDSRNPASPRGAIPASSPRRIRSSSPGLHSPASSLIFERNVQEAPLPDDLSSAIPAHIQTEDHIPPVLEASSLAITDTHLGPDEVEIVMHAAHQPAAASISAPPNNDALSPLAQHTEDSVGEADDTASNYGSLDTHDVRRLSFISFADVVQAEHAEHRDSSALHLSSISSTANRSPSPVRSPASSHGFGPSPPTSGAPSVKGVDIGVGKGGRGMGSPNSAQSPILGGELMVETMRQALRKTGSGDLGAARGGSLSIGAVGEGETPPLK
ncbi:hypothetical protein EJ06DRAFT_60794 [Trichodelitschia bisporula]|uniref:Uncharacterized protein n=1 Tax=Trichodelitschia bisporula TaxID=703511 RepID=A0A6G1HUZ2_9PEZI|nr:hypothetical protein EJ06DRAFT_60794 [Trichodelitschia bisporula]